MVSHSGFLNDLAWLFFLSEVFFLGIQLLNSVGYTYIGGLTEIISSVEFETLIGETQPAFNGINRCLVYFLLLL